MSKSKMFMITLLLLQCSFILSVRERNFLLLEADSAATCSCVVKSGFEAWGAYCSGNCNSQTGCNTYGAFCQWQASSSTTNTSSNTSATTTTCSCFVRTGMEPWGSHCSGSCYDQNQCGQYSFYCYWSATSSTSNQSTSNGTTTKSCPSNCNSHGTCNTATGVCSCSSGWTGSDCSTATCLNNCNNHGTCSGGVCFCSGGYTGNDCSIAPVYSCPNSCSGHGSCNTASGVCTCSVGYSGSDCSTSSSSLSTNTSSNTSSTTYNITGVIQVDPTCAPDWQWCKKLDWSTNTYSYRNCCSPLQFCNTSSTADWVGCDATKPEILSATHFPSPNWPGENVCGADGTTWNKYPNQDFAEPLEIAKIWVSATQGLTMAAHWQNKDGSWIRADKPGGMGTCIESVSLALGECGHSNHAGPHCSINGSGPGGFWQVTSQDTMDSGLARCSNGLDPCCNARIAYGHAWQTGFANTVPSTYCDMLPGNCGIDPQGTLSGWVKNQTIRETADHRKPGAIIPLCNHDVNPWYTQAEAAAALDYTTIDQEPCYWGPFGIAGGGYVKSFFINFNYAGSYFQHYVDSAWGCDPSPQVIQSERCYDSYTGAQKSYYQLAVEACAIVIGNITYVPPPTPYNGSSSSNSSSSTSNPIPCPSNCSSHGSCNTNTGVCSCSSGWQGTDCSSQIVLSCPSNCLGNGVCNTSTGVCACNSGWNGVDCGVSTASSNTSSNFAFEHSIYALTWTAWNPSAIFDLFKPACLGLSKQIYLAFGAPSQTVGIDFSGQSPNTTVWYQNQNMPAINVYKQAIVGLNLAAGVETLLSIGGWTYRSMFTFLATLNQTAMAAWAQKCKQVVDSFGAQGIDLDFEADTIQEWNDIMVKNNVIGALRTAMPSPQYVIKLTLPYGAALNLTSDKIGSQFNPPFNGGWGAQCSVDLVKLNWLDIDSINIMSYGNDPNLDPMQALNLNRQQINQYMGITNSQTRLNLGGMIGPQPGCTSNWCNWQISHTTSAAAYVKQQGYHGMFWWPDTGSISSHLPYYQEAYKQMYGTNPTPVSVAGVC